MSAIQGDNRCNCHRPSQKLPGDGARHEFTIKLVGLPKSFLSSQIDGHASDIFGPISPARWIGAAKRLEEGFPSPFDHSNTRLGLSVLFLQNINHWQYAIYELLPMICAILCSCESYYTAP